MGCPKNVVDSESMTLLLEQAGYREAAEQQADIVIVNTCGFIDPARKESLAAIHDALRRKRPTQALIAAGCLAQRYESQLVEQIPGLDGVLGTRHYSEVVGLVQGVATAKNLHGIEGGLNVRLEKPRRTSAYVKIADGCDRTCAFCAIPLIKGPFASRAVPDILADARRLAAEGVQEIVLVAQETSAYGFDRGERDALARLLPQIAAAVPQVPWLRFMYAYPTTVTPLLIETWAGLPQVVRYLDIPLQHAHPDVLRRMRRPHDVEHTLRLIADMRAALPGLALRTTFIVGYPGETEAEFQTLLDFMSEVRFDNVGVFVYSREEDTPASELPGRVPKRLAQERYRRAMIHQQRISLQNNQALLGETLDVLIEGQTAAPANGKKKRKEASLFAGRSYRDAPEIDGLVFARGQAAVGRIVPVHITEATEYDLWGEVETHQ